MKFDYDSRVELTKQFIEMYGEREYRDDISTRRTGRTTGGIFRILARCYAFPGEWIPIHDHFPTRRADQHMYEEMRSLVRKLDLKFDFKVNRPEYFVRVPYIGPLSVKEAEEIGLLKKENK